MLSSSIGSAMHVASSTCGNKRGTSMELLGMQEPDGNDAAKLHGLTCCSSCTCKQHKVCKGSYKSHTTSQGSLLHNHTLGTLSLSPKGMKITHIFRHVPSRRTPTNLLRHTVIALPCGPPFGSQEYGGIRSDSRNATLIPSWYKEALKNKTVVAVLVVVVNCRMCHLE